MRPRRWPGADPIQFRIDHAKDERAIGVLKAVREASGWKHAVAQDECRVNWKCTGARPRRFVMFRAGTYWACVCQIAVTPRPGSINVEKCTIAVDPG